MNWPNCSIVEMLEIIDGPNGKICQRIYLENKTLFCTVQGSTNNHQAWVGGYHDHIQEAMNWGAFLYSTIGQIRTLSFSLSDILLVIFLHDIEKPWKYELMLTGRLRHRKSLKTKKAQHRFRDKKLKKYGIVLSAEQENAMKYAEGELDDYTNQRRVMNELGGFVHICDVLSARVFHNYPRHLPSSLISPQRISERV